ncbi:MAG: hypothetical protein WCP93_02520 [Candidatus Berkelbacteria bacterium]
MINELSSAVDLAGSAGDLLGLLAPENSILRYYYADLNNNPLYVEFVNRFWDKDRGDWRRKPESLVYTFCLAKYFLAIKAEIKKVVFPSVNDAQFMRFGFPLVGGSTTWINDWLKGRDVFLTQPTNHMDAGHRINNALSVEFILTVDPRLKEVADDSPLKPLAIRPAVEKVMTNWRVEYVLDDLGPSEYTLTVYKPLNGVLETDPNEFGIKSSDSLKIHHLIEAIRNSNLALETHLQDQLFEVMKW